MRIAPFVAGLVIGSLLAIRPLVDPRIALPVVGADIEPICAEAMWRSPADLSWVAPERDERIRGQVVAAVSIGELPSHAGALVRVRGVLHAGFEMVGLYPSLAAMEKGPPSAPWVALDTLWPNEPYWNTKQPSISERCVVVEGTYRSGPGGHFGMFSGTIDDVLRLDVWSKPHRRFVSTTPVPPAPPPPPPAAPEPDNDTHDGA